VIPALVTPDFLDIEKQNSSVFVDTSHMDPTRIWPERSPGVTLHDVLDRFLALGPNIIQGLLVLVFLFSL
jgi:hypothetical protein